VRDRRITQRCKIHHTLALAHRAGGHHQSRERRAAPTLVTRNDDPKRKACLRRRLDDAVVRSRRDETRSTRETRESVGGIHATMAPSYEVIQSGGDENVASSSGRIGEETRERAEVDAEATAEEETRTLRRDPRWAVRAGARFEATVGERIREVTTLLDELRASQGKLRGEIEEAREAVAWTDAVEGAKETLERLPEYARKAQDANKRMRELRKRLERAEARVSALAS
jgi:hypothetical protein